MWGYQIEETSPGSSRLSNGLGGYVYRKGGRLIDAVHLAKFSPGVLERIWNRRGVVRSRPGFAGGSTCPIVSQYAITAVEQGRKVGAE